MKLLSVLSGGMDSSAALAKMLLTDQVIGAVSFNYGSKHNDKEWESARLIAQHYSVPIIRFDLDFMSQHFKSDLLKTGGEIPEGHYADPSMKKTVVPFRNGIMLSIAAGYAESIGAEGIILGNHFGDRAVYPDCRKEFIEPMQKAIELGTYAKIKLISPFCDVDKTEIARQGNDIGVPFNLTWSCYKGGEKHCGKCGTCVERIEAFKLANVKDETVYE